MSVPPVGRRLLRLVIAVSIMLGAAQAEVAYHCRRPWPQPDVTPEPCLWGRAYLPVGRTLSVLFGAPVLYGLLTLAEHALRRRDARDG